MNDPSNKSGWFSWLKQPKASQDSSSSNPEDEKQQEASQDSLSSIPEDEEQLEASEDEQDRKQKLLDFRRLCGFHNLPNVITFAPPNPETVSEPPSDHQAPEGSESSITVAEPPKEESFIQEQNPETASSSGPEKPLIQESEKPSSPKIPVNSFFLELNPVRNLKIAITALFDPEFNQEGTAMIQVDSNEFSLTVRTGLDGNVLGRFANNALGFIKYDFNNPLLRKKINLDDISQYLDLVPDEDSVTIYHVHGSDRLCFVLPGSIPVPYFDVELHELSPEFKEFPKINYMCLLDVLTENIWIHINRLRDSEEKMVSFGISDIKATLFVGPRGSEFTYKNAGFFGMEPEQVHHVWFRWPYCESLHKASLLTPSGSLGLLKDPEESIAWHFHLDNVDLLYVKKASKFLANSKG